MASKLWLKSTQQATDQSNPQKLNSEQNFLKTTTENSQTDLWQHSNASMSEKQNIDELLKTA